MNASRRLRPFPRRGPRPGFPAGGTAPRFWRAAFLALGALLALQALFAPGLLAFTIVENRIFSDGPYLFKLEIQVFGRGSSKKNPLKVSAVKVKIKNDRASSRALQVKAIRAYPSPEAHLDLETKGFPVSPNQWVTKYFRLPKERQPLLQQEGFIQIVFEGFSITFNPRDRKFQGPLK